MNHGPRRSLPLIVALAMAVLVGAGCGSTTTTAEPSPSVVPPPSSSASPEADASPSTAPTAAPATPTPTPTVAPSQSAAAEACPIAPQTGRLLSDRVTGVTISTSASADLVTFEFGNMSVPEPPQGASEGTLEAAVPPYTEAASGLPVEVTGEQVALVRFTGMSLMNDVGEPTYDGRLDFRPDLPALRSLVNYDMSEGVVGWYIGYDGGGCLTLRSDGRNVVVVIDHPPG